MNKKKYSLKNKISLIFITIIIFLLLINNINFFSKEPNIPEISLYKKTNNTILAYTLSPDYKRQEGEYIKTNSKGLRDYEYNYTKPNDTYRILAIGDSVTFGSLVDMKDSWPKQLEEILNQNTTKKYEVINMGVSGYTTLQEMEWIQLEGLKYEPDMIIIGYVLNDPLAFYNPLHQIYPIKYIIERENKIYSKIKAPSLCKIRNSLFKSKIMLKINEVFKFSYNRYLFVYPKGKTMSDIREVENNPDFYLKIHDNECTWKTISFSFEKIKNILKDIDVVIAIFPINFHNYNWKQEYPIIEVHNKIISEAKKNDFVIIDLLEEFKNYEQKLFWTEWPLDPVHYNKEGYTIAAKNIYENIKNIIDDKKEEE
ncbi:MAG: GDSL-type esterase/lipase family protein [Nanoarchaeota archaeon]